MRLPSEAEILTKRIEKIATNISKLVLDTYSGCDFSIQRGQLSENSDILIDKAVEEFNRMNDGKWKIEVRRYTEGSDVYRVTNLEHPTKKNTAVQAVQSTNKQRSTFHEADWECEDESSGCSSKNTDRSPNFISNSGPGCPDPINPGSPSPYPMRIASGSPAHS